MPSLLKKHNKNYDELLVYNQIFSHTHGKRLRLMRIFFRIKLQHCNITEYAYTVCLLFRYFKSLKNHHNYNIALYLKNMWLFLP